MTVTNSVFLDNDYNGLYTATNGAVMLKNVIASQNAGSGADIENTFDPVASPVTVTGAQFYGNSSEGLYIYSNGTVTVTSVLAQGNQLTGTLGDYRSGSGEVLLKGTNSFLDNGLRGLAVYSHGSVSAYQLAAHENASTGVYILTQKAVTISGSGRFTGNSGEAGLYVSAEGPIVAGNLTAISNRGIYGLAFESLQAVTLNKVNTKFNSNGIGVGADGKVTLSCGTAYGNTDNGLHVHNFGGTGPAAALRLAGFRSYLNGTDEILNGTPVVRAACP